MRVSQQVGGNRMIEASEGGGASEDASSASTIVATAKRPAVKRSARAPRRGWGKRLAAQGLMTLFVALLVASVVASLVESGWKSFNPISGIGIVQGVPLQPQGFGDTGSFPTPPPVPQTGSVAAISGATHKPTATATRTTRPTATASASATYPASWTGSWTGGMGQGCPSGGAPRPSTQIIYGVSHTNMVALTFDDGPTPYTSPPILSFLEQTHTPATFFVLGEYARAYPWLIQREAADGFAIGVHTWDHPDMELLSPSARAYQFGATIQQLHAILGPGFCTWLWRPPYGAVNSGIVEQAGAFGLTTIYWNVDPQDWARPGTMVIVNRVLSQVRPGSIILMHDGPAAREETAAALPYILAGLHARGLVPVTLPTLLGSESAATGPAPTATASATATATATATPIPTAAATATPSPTSTSTATATPTATATSGTTTGALGGSLPIALSLWLWYNTVPGYSGA